MAEYIVSARKYRPMRFSEMVGQEQVATTLKNAIRTSQLAHSFLFCGPRGVGKTTAARILAKTVNCENIGADFEACGTCDSCTAFQQNASFNIHELDAASNNSVEDIRALVDQVRFPPQTGKYKIYIIDEVHMLSSSAFNAFLKTLEEPPSYCKFILATTEKHKILPTILSRCQIFDFRRIGIETIVQHLQHICTIEKIEAEEEALHIIAQKADGGMRDALSMFDRLSGFGNGKLTYASVLENLNVLDYDYFFKVTDTLLTENVSLVFQLLDEILKKGFEGDDFMLGLCEHFRNLLFCKDNATLRLMEVSQQLKQKYHEQATLASADFIINCLNIGNQCDVQYKQSKNKRLTVELALVKMCYVNSLVALDDASGKKKAPELKQAAPLEQKAVLMQPDTGFAKKQSPESPQPPAPKPPVQDTVKEESPSLIKTPPVTATKGKKLLTLDALKDANLQTTSSPADTPLEQNLPVGEMVVLNEDSAQLIWEEYAARIPEEKRSLRTLFARFKPVLNTQLQLEVKFQSETQLAQFDEVKGGVKFYYESRTGAVVDILSSADATIQSTAKLYKPIDILHHMMEKNPAIKKMQQELGLELDYD
ncbi:MAG: DNA polymerase III subunit gamma/tau [Bacteroidetes bacterium]|nr:DNA polymerase III subunit gamma/tau [Bacteroidota bacterium]